MAVMLGALVAGVNAVTQQKGDTAWPRELVRIR